MIKRLVYISVLVITGILTLTGQPFNKIIVDNDIQLIPLQDSIYVHVSWHYLEDAGRFSSNGMVIIKNGEALMIDTPMDNDKTERLVEYLHDSLSVEISKLLIGHFHDDCLGGLGYLQSKGIESVANYLTIEKCKEKGLPVPSISFKDSFLVNFNGLQIDCRYFGAGHTIDNITVWLPEQKILFGGCLIRSLKSQSLGNLSDAVVPEWDKTVMRLMNQYKNINIVIPGHGDFGGKELLVHTIDLVNRYKFK